jgi:uncharacterized MAPEG superfamily protein
MKWNASARDGDAKPLSPLAGRLQRAQANFLETFPFFAAAAIAVVVAGRGNDTTALAAQAYFWARVVYLPCTPQACPTCAAWCGWCRCCRSWRWCSHFCKSA